MQPPPCHGTFCHSSELPPNNHCLHQTTLLPPVATHIWYQPHTHSLSLLHSFVVCLPPIHPSAHPCSTSKCPTVPAKSIPHVAPLLCCLPSSKSPSSRNMLQIQISFANNACKTNCSFSMHQVIFHFTLSTHRFKHSTSKIHTHTHTHTQQTTNFSTAQTPRFHIPTFQGNTQHFHHERHPCFSFSSENTEFHRDKTICIYSACSPKSRAGHQAVLVNWWGVAIASRESKSALRSKWEGVHVKMRIDRYSYFGAFTFCFAVSHSCVTDVTFNATTVPNEQSEYKPEIFNQNDRHTNDVVTVVNKFYKSNRGGALSISHI